MAARKARNRNLTGQKPFYNEDLWNAALDGAADKCSLLLTDGLRHRPDLADIPEPDKFLAKARRPYDGSTALFAAAAGGYVTVMEVLLQHDGDLTQCRNDGASPFYIACLSGHLPAARFIFSKLGPSALLATTYEDMTPLLAAVSRSHDAVAVFLVDESRKGLGRREHVCHLEMRTVKGHTACTVARMRGQHQIAAYIEWNLRKPGVRIAGGEMEPLPGHVRPRCPDSPPKGRQCGLQVRVENNGRSAAAAACKLAETPPPTQPSAQPSAREFRAQDPYSPFPLVME
mmetsp:Transcript_11379/g.26736  ORF Transcript_11379/g.26736 Transcript_11379/m.26736 type:complete len:287 (+) Transcript_11379:34-894(+)